MIIGISGKIGCGKTFLAMHLQDLIARDHVFGEGVPVLRAMADPLKQECSDFFGFPLDWCYCTAGKGTPMEIKDHRDAYAALGMFATVRELMQWYGTDYRRAEDKDYWIKAFDSYVAQDLRMGNHLIVHDVRFSNEATWVLDRGGVLLRMAPYPGWKPGPHADHESETALDDFPHFTQVLTPGLGQLHRTARMVFRLYQGLP